MEKRTKVVYEVPCSCGKVYIGKTIRTLEARIKEHKKAVQEADYKSAIAEHVWEEQHRILWDGVRILDTADREDLLLKEAVHIQLREDTEKIKREGVNLPGMWSATIGILDPPW